MDVTVEGTEGYMREDIIVATLSARKGRSFVDVVWFGRELRAEGLCTRATLVLSRDTLDPRHPRRSRLSRTSSSTVTQLRVI